MLKACVSITFRNSNLYISGNQYLVYTVRLLLWADPLWKSANHRPENAMLPL